MQRLVHNVVKTFIKLLCNFDNTYYNFKRYFVNCLWNVSEFYIIKLLKFGSSNATSNIILLHCVNLINVNIILWPNLKGALHGDSFYSDGFMCKICTMYHISSFLINGKFHLNELSSKLPRFSVLMWEVSDIRSTVLVSVCINFWNSLLH